MDTFPTPGGDDGYVDDHHDHGVDVDDDDDGDENEHDHDVAVDVGDDHHQACWV